MPSLWKCSAAYVLACGCALSLLAAAPDNLRIRLAPAQPLIEHQGSMQVLNFDFILRNDGTVAQHLNRIEISVYDSAGHLVLRRALDENGRPSGMSILDKHDVPAKQEISVFNPFYAFDRKVPVGRLKYTFYFNAAGAEMMSPLDYETFVDVPVAPVDYTNHAHLELPVKARSIIFDGHDFYAHHRRIDLAEPPTGQNLLHGGNPVRYGYDFCPVSADGAMYQDDPHDKKHWYGYGTPIYATASGVVAEAANDVPENEYRGKEVVHPEISELSSAILGNHVVLDHGHGEVSVFAHMQSGSVRVKKGDHVRQGQIIGLIGFSGDAFIPHLHYMLTSGPDLLNTEGLPSYFRNFRRVLGAKRETVSLGGIDSGDIVEATPRLSSGDAAGATRPRRLRRQ